MRARRVHARERAGRGISREALGRELASGLWLWRVELAGLVVLFAAWRLGSGVLGGVVAGAAVCGAVGGLLMLRPARHQLTRLARRARVTRAWEFATVDAGLAAYAYQAPRVRSVQRVPAGDVVGVRVRRGQAIADLDARADVLAASLRAREVRVERDCSDGSRACVTLVRRDPFERAEPVRWPLADAEAVSLWEPIPVGIDEHGQPVAISLVERNMLLGGEPGAGKSAALGLLIAAAALDPDARLWLLDGKQVELAAWAPVAQQLATTDPEAALGLLRDLQEVMEDRYRELLARGLRKVPQDPELPLHVVACDELAFYLNLPDKKQRQEFAELLRDLVARGRAAGIIVLAATQKPGTETVPSSLRDLFGFRLALRCNTPQASDTILGQGWASAGHDASTIPGGQRGVGLLRAEEDQPSRLRTFYLTDPEISQISTRAAQRRADGWLADVDTNPPSPQDNKAA